MSNEEKTADKKQRGEITAILILMLTNLTSAGLGFYLSGEQPEVVDVTCEMAVQIAASESCMSDEDRIEAEEEAAENSDPGGL
tara:strand:- start:73 stop:321 length:249 start_codon:yes stop_codon:yes gene_type:complete